jgi:endonuclease III related protein
MPTLDQAFDAVLAALRRHYGPAPHDFQGLAPFEAMIAVFLDRELGSKRWRPALDALSDHGFLRPDRLADAEIPEITDALRERGIAAHARTIAPLKRLGRWASERGSADFLSLETADALADDPPISRLRGDLGSIKGITPAAVDAVVLFALKRPSYPVDRATYRVLVRHGWLDATASYEEARDFLVDRALFACNDEEQGAVAALSDLSHAMERLGQQYCRAAEARCHGCPLESLLPEGGPREVDA